MASNSVPRSPRGTSGKFEDASFASALTIPARPLSSRYVNPSRHTDLQGEKQPHASFRFCVHTFTITSRVFFLDSFSYSYYAHVCIRICISFYLCAYAYIHACPLRAGGAEMDPEIEIDMEGERERQGERASTRQAEMGQDFSRPWAMRSRGAGAKDSQRGPDGQQTTATSPGWPSTYVPRQDLRVWHRGVCWLTLRFHQACCRVLQRLA